MKPTIIELDSHTCTEEHMKEVYQPLLDCCSRDKEKFEDTKEVIKSLKLQKDGQYNGRQKKGQTTIYKTPHRKLWNLMQCARYLEISYNESIGPSAVGFCWDIIMINLIRQI